MTIDDLEAMPDDGNRYEIIEGELFVSCAPGLTHQRVFGNIFYLIRNYLESNPIGEVIATPGLMLSRFSGVMPDIVFFNAARHDRIVAGERLISAPDLVIEILSPGPANIQRDRVAKRQLYAKHDVPEYWIVDIAARKLEVHRLQDQQLELFATLQDQDQVVTPVLPGFTCSASDIFQL